MTFLVGFCYVFLLGIQQQNITHEKHLWSMGTSMMLAVVMVYLVRGAVEQNAGLFIIEYGTGSALGASLSIIIHKWARRPRSVIGETIK